MRRSFLRGTAQRIGSLVAVLVIAVSVWVALGGRLPQGSAFGNGDPVSSMYLDWEYGSGTYPLQMYMSGNGYDFSSEAADPQYDSFRFKVHELYEPFRWFSVTISAGQGQDLAVGEYNAAQSQPGPNPSLQMFPICNNNSGRFAVHQIEMASPSQVSRLAMSFEIHCQPGAFDNPVIPAVFGELLFNATDIQWAGLTMTSTASFAAPGTTAPITVTNVGSVAQDLSAQIVGPEAPNFSIDENDCGTLEPGAHCQLTVRFAPVANAENGVFTPARPGKSQAMLVVSDQTAASEHITNLTGNSPVASGVSLTVAANPVTVGTAVVLHAGVTANASTVELYDGDQLVGTKNVVSGGADFQLNLPSGTHWMKASILVAGTGRSESYPLKVVVQP